MRFAFPRAWLFVLLLAGCASAPPAGSSLRPAGAENAPFVLNGRIAVRHDGERTSANVRWTHRQADDDILLLAPFGQTVAHIYRNAQGVTLDTSDKHYTAQDAGELTEKALGWHLPLSGLRYWVLGLPEPGVQFDAEHEPNGQVGVLHQDGWEIRYAHYAQDTPDSLPQRISLQREDMQLQLLIDEWDIQ